MSAVGWLRAGGLSLAVLGGGMLRDTAARAAEANDKPFSEHHLALQLSDREPTKQALVLSVANNLLRAYGPDKISIEVVAFGPGIDLLRQESPNLQLVDSLVAQGVVFDVCMNSVETVERETGKPVPLNPKAHPVEAGVAQLLTLAESGYSVVRP